MIDGLKRRRRRLLQLVWSVSSSSSGVVQFPQFFQLRREREIHENDIDLFDRKIGPRNSTLDRKDSRFARKKKLEQQQHDWQKNAESVVSPYLLWDALDALRRRRRQSRRRYHHHHHLVSSNDDFFLLSSPAKFKKDFLSLSPIYKEGFHFLLSYPKLDKEKGSLFFDFILFFLSSFF